MSTLIDGLPMLLERSVHLWEEAKRNSESKRRVLIATSLGSYDCATTMESLLGVALTLRGAQVEYLLCDEFLPACQASKIGMMPDYQFAAEGPKSRCQSCYTEGRKKLAPLGLPIHTYSSLVSNDLRELARAEAAKVSYEEISNFRYDGLAVGEHALAGALRYYARGTLEMEPYAEAVLRRYLTASLLTVFAVQQLLREQHFEVACFHHGIYVPQGLIGEVCRQKKVRVVNWNPSYREQTFVFSHSDSYHHTMLDEPTSSWENLELTHDLSQENLEYLRSRWHGSKDWIWFHEKPEINQQQIIKETGIDFSKPCIGMLSSVMWDAQLHYRSNAFPTMLSWVKETLRYFIARPDLQLIVRVHPAEVHGDVPSRQPLVVEIKRLFPNLPPNIFIVPPESNLSTYALMERCDAVLIYSTKTGIELASMGIPIIVAGEAWIRNKGFSIDVTSPQEYRRVLDTLPLGKRMSAEQMDRARRYAYHFFFRRMIPLPFVVSPQKFHFTLELEHLEQLAPNASQALDVICQGILQGSPFIYPAESLSQ